MNWELAILWFITFVISITVHEAAHAWTAMLGGDRTAYRAGQVTLNPIPHMQREPFGMLILPIASIWMSGGQYCFGFAHAPYDPIWAHHHPKRAALMSAAGPLANVLLAAIAFAVLWFVGRPDSGTTEAVRQIAGIFLRLNILLAIFNIIPLPPLDGAGILSGLSRPARQFYDGIMRFPYTTIIVMVLLFKGIPYLYWPAFLAVNDLLPYPLPLR